MSSVAAGYHRILGLDYGTKTVGVAISDPLLITAQELETIKREKPKALRATLRRIAEICEEYGVEKIVLGLPLLPSGDEGERALATREFMTSLSERVNVPIILQNESYTTVAADEILEESGIDKCDRKKVIDQIAAAIILQEYLDNRR